MREAYRRVHKDAAAGVDGVTTARYGAELEANLSSLLERLHPFGRPVMGVRKAPIPADRGRAEAGNAAGPAMTSPDHRTDTCQALEARWRGLTNLGGRAPATRWGIVRGTTVDLEGRREH